MSRDKRNMLDIHTNFGPIWPPWHANWLSEKSKNCVLRDMRDIRFDFQKKCPWDPCDMRDMSETGIRKSCKKLKNKCKIKDKIIKTTWKKGSQKSWENWKKEKRLKNARHKIEKVTCHVGHVGPKFQNLYACHACHVCHVKWVTCNFRILSDVTHVTYVTWVKY